MNFSWIEEHGRLHLSSEGLILMDDSVEHWRNAVLRLMGWDDIQGRTFTEAAIKIVGGPRIWNAADTHTRLDALASASRVQFPEPETSLLWCDSDLDGIQVLGRSLNRYWARAISGDANWAMAGTRAAAHGALLSRASGKIVLATPPEYEESYFEGNVVGYGYGKLEAQEAWRMEKARRQVGQVAALLTGTARRDSHRKFKLLDVGSGYGYLRAAAAELNWEHYGIELSRHACAVAQRLFGFETCCSTLDQAPTSAYDVITLMDLVEHVPNPIGLLEEVSKRLAPGGLCVVRTPNLLAWEAQVFGHRYHSLKREHLHMFSCDSLASCFTSAGLESMRATTEAHLLSGFLGSGIQQQLTSQHGSDILAVARRPL